MSRFNTGNPLGSGSPLDLDDNAKNLDEAVNSQADTFQDRLGKSRLTWAGIVKAGSGDPAIAVDAADRAVDAADRAESAESSVEQNAEQIAQNAAEQAVQDVVADVDGQVAVAQSAADRAESAAEVAMAAGWIYTTKSEGESARVDGDYFWVISATDNEVLELWLMGASTATDTDKRTVSSNFSQENSLFPFKHFTTESQLSNGILKLDLTGDIADRLLTLALWDWNASTNQFSIIIASPDSESEVMSSSSNTKYVARFLGELTSFSGVQTLELSPYGSGATGLNISGFITINFDVINPIISRTANYTASERLLDNRVINDNNDYYNFGNDNSLLPFKQFQSHYGLANAIKKIELSGDFAGRILAIAQFYHRASDGLMQIIIANPDTESEVMSTSNTKYVSRFVTSGFVFSGVQRLELVPYGITAPNIGGYITVDFDAINEGINVSTTSYVASDRLIDNRVIVETNKNYQSNKDLEVIVNDGLPAVNERVDLITNPYNPSNLSSNALSERFYKGVLGLELYGNYRDGVVCLSYFYYNPTTKDLRVILSLADNEDEVINASSNTKFCSEVIVNLPIYGGVQTLDLVPYGTLSAQGIGGKLTIDLAIVTSGSTLSANYTAHARAFNMYKIEDVNWQVSGGVNKYGSLSQALTAGEADPFYVGGNSFKSRLPTPQIKSDFICSNAPKRELSKKPAIKTYEVSYLGSKVKLEWIDSEDNFYYVADDAIIKLPNPLSQSLTVVANPSAADLVIYDVDASVYYEVSNFDVLFTSTSLSVTKISHIKLTFDEEILIITKNASNLDIIMLTENNQSSLRTMDFNGTVADRYTFGEGVFILKDWSLSHHGDVMFISDYDSGVGGVRGTTGGQRCYVSLDNGYTFTECFQFTGNWTNLTNAGDITAYQQSSAHIHCVAYDHKQGIVWLATGDGGSNPDNTAFIWSRDLGQTWTHQRSRIIDTGQKSQMVNAIPFDGCIAFGSDDSSLNGMGVITYNGNEFVHEVARNFIPAAGRLLMYARNAWQRSDNKVKYVSFGQDTANASNPDARSLVCASSNGYDWETVWEDNASGIYGNVYSFSDSKGNIFVTLDGDATNRKRMLSIKTGFI